MNLSLLSHEWLVLLLGLGLLLVDLYLPPAAKRKLGYAAALGVAAHETGHAFQDISHYPLLGIRNGLVPLAGIGSTLSWIILEIRKIYLALSAEGIFFQTES